MLGHSERRQLFGETDEALSRKVPVALEAGLVPILCVGETEDERERDETDRILRRQIDAGLSRVPAERLAEVVVAYEPIWAIGTGRTATPEQAEDACGFVRSLISARDEAAAAEPSGSTTAARSSPATRPSCSAARRSTARWSAAPASTPTTSPRSSRRRGEPRS